VPVSDLYQAFTDDSGGQETPERYLVLAAYALPADQWVRFSDDWHKTLHLMPEIEYLKMQEAEGFEGEFRGMRSRPEFRELKLNELCAVIGQYKPYAMYAWLRRSDYSRIIEGRLPSEVDTPYFLTMQGLIELCLQAQVRYDYWGPVDFIFDTQSNIEHAIGPAFNAAKAAQPPHLQRIIGQTPVFRDDKEVKPLQAADMLAWHLRRRLERPDELRSRMGELLSGGDCEKEYDADALRAVLVKWAFEFMRHILETNPDQYEHYLRLMSANHPRPN
jgi:hypothetical protein